MLFPTTSLLLHQSFPSISIWRCSLVHKLYLRHIYFRNRWWKWLPNKWAGPQVLPRRSHPLPTETTTAAVSPSCRVSARRWVWACANASSRSSRASFLSKAFFMQFEIPGADFDPDRVFSVLWRFQDGPVRSCCGYLLRRDRADHFGGVHVGDRAQFFLYRQLLPLFFLLPRYRLHRIHRLRCQLPQRCYLRHWE